MNTLSRLRSYIPENALKSITKIFTGKTFYYITGLTYGIAGARILGADGFGQLVLIISIVTIISRPFNLSLESPLVKSIRSNLENSRLSHTYSLIGIATWAQIIACVIFAILFLLFLVFGARYWTLFNNWQTAIGLFGISMVIKIFRDQLSFIFKVNEYFGLHAFQMSFQGFSRDLMVIPFMFWGVTSTCMGFIVAEVLILSFFIVTFMVNYGYYRLAKCFKPTRIWGPLSELYSVARSNYLSSIFNIIFSKGQNLILGDVISSSAVGYFDIGKKLRKAFPFVLNPVKKYLYPRIVEKWERDKSEFFYTIRKYFYSVGSLSILSGVALALVAPYLITALYGPDFYRSVWVFWILVPGIVVSQVMSIFTNIVFTIEEARHLYLQTCFQSIVGLVFTVLLVPSLGDLGAALATTLSMLFLSVYQAVILFNKLGISWIIPTDH